MGIFLTGTHFFPDRHGLGDIEFFGAGTGIIVFIGCGKKYVVETGQIIGMGRALLS